MLEHPSRKKALNKLTIVPIAVAPDDILHSQRTSAIGPDVTLEEMSGVFSADTFDLWKEYLSTEQRKRLASTSHALIHHFDSDSGDDKSDESSRLLMNHVFICLRIIKPIDTPFRVIQGYVGHGRVEVYGFSAPTIEHPNLPLVFRGNRVTAADIDRLRRLLPGFMSISGPGGPIQLQRGIRFYEQALSTTTEPSLQFLSWMIAVEAVLSKGERLTPTELATRMIQSFGDEDFGKPEWYESGEGEALLVRDHVQNLIELRNCIVHAQPFPDKFREMRRDRFGQERELAEYLNGGAAKLAQMVILQEISALELHPQ